MDPLFRPARGIMTVKTEAEPRIVQPLLRVGGVEGTPHRHETSLQKMLDLFAGQVSIAPRHAISSRHDFQHFMIRRLGRIGANRLRAGTSEATFRSGQKLFYPERKWQTPPTRYQCRGCLPVYRLEGAVYLVLAAPLRSLTGSASPSESTTTCIRATVSSSPSPIRGPGVKVAGRCFMPWMMPIVW